MSTIRFRDQESCDFQPDLQWDTVWVQRLDASGGYGDWILAGPDEPDNAGGLRAQAALHTAMLLCLFTDRRLPDGMANPGNDGDRRGWWGDSVPIEGEPDVPLGSLLWTLERGVLNERTALAAQDYAEEALAVLARQGAVARTAVTVGADAQLGRLDILVEHYSHDGARVYEQKFARLWGQTMTPARMNYGEGLNF